MSTQLKIASLLFVACVIVVNESTTAQPPAKKTDIRGVITKLQGPGDVKNPPILAVVLIEGEMAKDVNHDKASVKITDKTTLKKLVGNEMRDAKLEDLKVGCTIEAKFVGPVAESYPVQATAGEIVILKEAK